MNKKVPNTKEFSLNIPINFFIELIKKLGAKTGNKGKTFSVPKT